MQKIESPEIILKTAYLNTDKIHTLEQAKSMIDQITDLYNKTKNKYNDAIKINSSLNLEIVKLKDEVAEFQRVLKNREK